jgi:hypothetical protein
MRVLSTASRGRGLLGGLALASLGACSAWSDPGVSVALEAQPSVSVPDIAPGDTRLRVDELRWTSSEIELEPCPGAFQSALHWLLPEAQAHGTSSPTELAVPTVVSATEAAAVPLGELAPPAGRYCGVRYRVAAADADALGLSRAPSMRGMSLHVRGTLLSVDGVEEPFELLTGQPFERTMPIEFELSSAEPSVRLAIRCDVGIWPPAEHLLALDAAARNRSLADAFSASLGVQLE